MKTNVNKGFFIFLSQRQLTTSGSPLILFVKLVPALLFVSKRATKFRFKIDVHEFFEFSGNGF